MNIRSRHAILATFLVLITTMAGCATTNTAHHNTAGVEIKPGAVVTLVVVNNRDVKERRELEKALFQCIQESVQGRELNVRLLDPAQLPTVPDYQKGWNAYAENLAWNNALRDYNVDTLIVVSERSLGLIRGAWQNISASVFSVQPELNPVGTIKSKTVDKSGFATILVGAIFVIGEGAFVFPIPLALPPSLYRSRNCKGFGDASAGYFANAQKVRSSLSLK
jgi:hypothetical protein